MRYEKGRKDASRQRIMDAAGERFRSDGIAATGLAAVMADAGMTNGAFYPHFQSKADLVRETMISVMDRQAEDLRKLVADGGLEAAIAFYLSPEHRDNPAIGCSFAALLPELARQPLEARTAYADHFLAMVREVAPALPKAPTCRNASLPPGGMPRERSRMATRSIHKTEPITMDDVIIIGGSF